MLAWQLKIQMILHEVLYLHPRGAGDEATANEYEGTPPL